MKDTIFKFLRLDNLFGNLSGYVESRLELYKIEIREDFGRALAKAMVVMMLALVGFLFLVFFSVGLAHFINSFLDLAYAGYWIVASIYGLIFLFVFIFKDDINSNFEKRFIELTKRKEK